VEQLVELRLAGESEVLGENLRSTQHSEYERMHHVSYWIRARENIAPDVPFIESVAFFAFICFYDFLLFLSFCASVSLLTKCCWRFLRTRSHVLASCFEYRSKNLRSEVSVVSRSLSRNILRRHLKIGHNRFIPHPFEDIIIILLYAIQHILCIIKWCLYNSENVFFTSCFPLIFFSPYLMIETGVRA
jgi:hypothetical protein